MKIFFRIKLASEREYKMIYKRYKLHVGVIHAEETARQHEDVLAMFETLF